MTKLGLNSGNGASVIKHGLPWSIGSHSTLTNWQTTHFLSFSEDRTIAEGFMMQVATTKRIVKVGDAWNGHIVSFDQARFASVVPQGDGVYLATWCTPGIVKTHQILIVDVVTYMRHASVGHKAPFAQQEKEWVLLPMDPMPDPNTPGQLKAQISHTFINQAEFYELA